MKSRIVSVIAISVGVLACSAGSAPGGEVAIANNRIEGAIEQGLTANLTDTQPLRMRITMSFRNQAEMQRLLADQQDPNSPYFRRWLTPAEFTARFGPTADDVAKVTQWLSDQGFTVTRSSTDARAIDFTGPAATAASAFSVRIVATPDSRAYANLNDPLVPADLAPMIASIGGLDNLSAIIVPPHQPLFKYSKRKNAFGPLDMYTFYNESPLLTAGNSGQHADCIALMEFSDFDDGSIDAFDKAFGLPALADGQSLLHIAVNGSATFQLGGNIEALLDVEYAHAAAPGTKIRAYLMGSNEIDSTVLQDLAQQAVTDNACGTISSSIGVCSADPTIPMALDGIYQQAALQGQTVLTAAGDRGAAGSVFSVKKLRCVAGSSRHVEETGASPNLLSIGGTQFHPKFDKQGNDVGSATESVWEEKVGASGGGASKIFQKPSYQNGVTPKDNARDLPDISLNAATSTPGYVLAAFGGLLCCFGGTSFAAPYWAGIITVMEDLAGQRLGEINSRLYVLASQSVATAGIRDVTKGNNGFHGVKGFAAKKGYDQATGWGTVDITTFAHAFTGK